MKSCRFQKNYKKKVIARQRCHYTYRHTMQNPHCVQKKLYSIETKPFFPTVRTHHFLVLNNEGITSYLKTPESRKYHPTPPA